MLFPYGSIGYGDVPLVMGMALLPITVVVAMQALTMDEGAGREEHVESIIAAGLLVFAAIVVHTSQVPLILLLVGLLALERGVAGAFGSDTPGVRRARLAVGAVVIVLLAPTLRRLVSGVSERSSIFLTSHLSVRSARRPYPHAAIPQEPNPQTVLALLTFAGVAIWLWRRRPAWVVGYALVLGLTLLVWVSHGSLSNALGVPWYHSAARLSFNQAFFVSFFAGFALAYVAEGFVLLDKRRPLRSLLIASIVVAVVFAATLGYDGYRTSTAASCDATLRSMPESLPRPRRRSRGCTITKVATTSS